jgi:hypothetical protein
LSNQLQISKQTAHLGDHFKEMVDLLALYGKASMNLLYCRKSIFSIVYGHASCSQISPVSEPANLETTELKLNGLTIEDNVDYLGIETTFLNPATWPSQPDVCAL